jgi:uncharacterized protein
MLKVIVDTNVIISHVISKSSNVDLLISLRKSEYLKLYISPEAWMEIKATMQKQKVRVKVGRHAASFFAQYKYACEFVVPRTKVDFTRDPKDAKFLELAVEVDADFLVTGDKDLLDIKKFGNTKIVTLDEFLVLNQ